MPDAFLAMLVAERGASANTLAAYRRDMAQFAGFCQHHKKAMVTADAADVAQFIHSLAGLAPRSRARKLSVLKQYYRFLVSEKIRADDPTAAIAAPKLPRHLPQIMAVEATETLLHSVAGDRLTPEAVRLQAMLELCYGSGLRVSELVGLPLQAWQPSSPVMLVRGKGGKERLVPLSQPSRQALAAYLAVRPHFLGKNPKATAFLFPSSGKTGHLTRIRFYQLLKQAALLAGLPATIHPHSLRHAFATHLLQGGADLRSLQLMLGHADITTTQIYTHVVGDHLQQTVHHYHPLARETVKAGE